MGEGFKNTDEGIDLDNRLYQQQVKLSQVNSPKHH
jgi:hypothetical protein